MLRLMTGRRCALPTSRTPHAIRWGCLVSVRAAGRHVIWLDHHATWFGEDRHSSHPAEEFCAGMSVSAKSPRSCVGQRQGSGVEVDYENVTSIPRCSVHMQSSRTMCRAVCRTEQSECTYPARQMTTLLSCLHNGRADLGGVAL